MPVSFKPVDPLSEVLALLKPEIMGFRGLDAGEVWALRYEAARGIQAFSIRSGQFWIAIDGSDPIELVGGDFIVVAGTTGFTMYSRPDAPQTCAYEFFSSFPVGETGVLGGGGESSGIGGFFDLGGEQLDGIVELLPPLIHIEQESARVWLGFLTERLMTELRSPSIGSALIGTHLAQMLLIESLRAFLGSDPAQATGWLCALSDRQLGAAISAIHAAPARRWTVEDLAREAGMSRTSFAVRFKEVVGRSPIEYLNDWRMAMAADRLAAGDVRVSTLRRDLGYESDSAFTAAFKRRFGDSPKSFAKDRGGSAEHSPPRSRSGDG